MNKWAILILAVLALFMIVGYIGISGQQTEEVTKVEFETILVGKGSSPKWSPDGSKLAFLSEGWLCWATPDGERLEKVAQMFPRLNSVRFDWVNAIELVIYERTSFRLDGSLQYIFRLRTADLNGDEQTLLMDSSATKSRPGSAIDISYPTVWHDGTISYKKTEYRATTKDSKPQKLVTTEILRHGKIPFDQLGKEVRAVTVPSGNLFGTIWLKSLDGTIEKRITKGEATYSFPQLSPDGSKILALSHRSEMIIFNLEGVELVNLGLGGADANWSPDSKRVVYDIQKQGGEDGAFIVASELYIANLDTTEKIQITNTTDEIEADPIWSPDGTMVACNSLNTSNIFVIKIK